MGLESARTPAASGHTGSQPGRHPGGHPGSSRGHPGRHPGGHPGSVGNAPAAGPQKTQLSPFPRHVGPPLSEAERRIVLDSPSHRLAVWASAALSLITSLSAAMICVWIGQAVAALDVSPKAVPLGVHPFGWIVLAGASEGARVLLEQRAASTLVSSLQIRLLGHAFALGPARVASGRTGSLVSLMTQGAEKIALYRQTYLGPLAGGLLTPVVALVVMATLVDAWAAAILCALTPAPPALVWLFTRFSRKAGAGSRRARGELAARYLDAIQGLETLAITGAARRMARDLAETGERNRASTMRMLKSNQLVLFVIDAGFNLVFLTCGVIVAAWRVHEGAIAGGRAVAIVALTLLMLEPMAQIGGFFYVGMGGRANQAAARKFLGRAAPDEGPAARLPVGAPGLAAHDLTFAYPGGESVVRGLDLEVAPGEHVAIVGPSGQGKSTLITLLTGSLAPTSGTISLDGTPASPPTLRAASALVAQSTWLFTGSVRDNLALAAPSATDAEMWAALTAARLDEEVCALPHGLDTVIGERGSGLSGGQAQRLSLARAFISGRRLLVLDEPTSSIDLASEAALMRTVSELGRDYTVVLVTHRSTALAGFDRTLRLAGGLLTEEENR